MLHFDIAKMRKSKRKAKLEAQKLSYFEPFLSDFIKSIRSDAFWDDAADHRSAGITLAGIFSAAI